MIHSTYHMSEPVKHIIDDIKGHSDTHRLLGFDIPPYYIYKNDHDILANFIENRVFLYADRDKDSPDIKTYLGVELIIIGDKMNEFERNEIINRFDEHIKRIKKLEEQQDHDKNRITYVNQLVIDLEKKFEKDIKDTISGMGTYYQFNKLKEQLEIQIERISRLENRIENKELELSRKSLLPTEKRLTEILREQLPGHEIEIKFVGSGG